MLEKYKTLLTKERLQKANLTLEEVEYVSRNFAFYKNDIFRFVMASNDTKSIAILKHFVGLIIKRKVLDILVCESEPVKETNNEKGVRMDIVAKCMDTFGNESCVNLEIQNYGSLESVSLRSQVYAAKMVVSQVRMGNNGYQFNEVYQVMILKNVKSNKKSFYHEYMYMEDNGNSVLPSNRMHLVFVELDKLNQLDENNIDSWTEMEQLGYMIRYAHDENKRDIIKLLKEKSEVLKIMLDKKEDFFSNMVADLNKMKAMFNTLDQEDFERKLEEVKEEGMKQGIQRLLQIMYKNGADLEEISKLCSMKIEDVKDMVE